MTKITKIAVSALLGLAVLSTTVSADAAKGQKLYMKKMKSSCGFSGAKFAAKHSVDEWTAIKDGGKFEAEAAALCGGVKVKAKHAAHIVDFAIEYASDSGNVPSC